jgi:hypothetical protein
MKNLKYYLALVAFSLIAAMFFVSRSSTVTGDKRDPSLGNQHLISSRAADESSVNQVDSFPKKSKIRPQKPTIEETKALLESVIIPYTDLPEQSFKDRLEALNELIQKADLPPHMLKITYHEPVYDTVQIFDNHLDPNNYLVPSGLNHLDAPLLKAKNLPLRVILEYNCAMLKMKMLVKEGEVRFVAITG